jgi:enoyl-CoA hydratase/carnithine racemase
MDDLLLESKTGAVTKLRLNRPKSRNALSLEMISALQTALDRLAGDADTHVIVIAAEGPVFCAGHDLKEITQARAADDNGRVFFETIMSACSKMMQSVVTCPKPVIAEVQGVATAAGCQLVASCDLAVASKDAGFATPGVNIGLFCSTPMVALSRNLARKHAMEMLLTGDIIDAETARGLGLVNRVVAAQKLSAETMALAQQIASKSPKTLKIGKEAFYAQAEMPLNAAYDYAGRVMVANLMERDSREGIDAFIEKRPAHWDPLD